MTDDPMTEEKPPETQVAPENDQTPTESRRIQEEIIDKASAGFQTLPMLDIIFSRMATGIASTFKSRAGLISDISFDAVEYLEWGAAVSDLDPNGVCAIASARPWGKTLAVVIDSSFMFAALEAQMGGNPKPDDMPDRPASQIEQQLSRHTIDLILSDLSHNFSRVTEARFSIDSMEPPRQMTAIHGASSPCIRARVDVGIGKCRGSFSVIIPFSTIAPVQDRLSKMFLGEKLGADTSWREHIVSKISGSNVTVAARMHEMRIPINDILSWSPGDTIDMGILPDQEIDIVCSGIPVLHGNAGRIRNGSIAVRLTRDGDVSKERAPDAPAEDQSDEGAS